ncbi:MAG TPA: aldo/keto reductase [Candidatus Tumulicola sp.]|jgi:aryl-alcohol dehydrogenase-like predicted oxidoreductase
MEKLGGTITIGGDLTVHRLGFGAMRITGEGIWGEPKDRGNAVKLMRHVVESGVNFIDTADSYGPGVSEEIIAEALSPYKDGVVIGTKAGFERPGPGDWEENGHPKHLCEAVEGSLKRLKLERIDLLQLHRIDPKVPVAESLGALVELQQAGKIRHIGLSQVGVGELREAQKTATIVSVQNRYNVADREYDDVVDECERQGLAFLPWFPLAGEGTPEHDALQKVAKAHETTPTQIAIAWLLARSTAMLPIPGTSSIDHFDENIASAEIELTPEQMEELG